MSSIYISFKPSDPARPVRIFGHFNDEFGSRDTHRRIYGRWTCTQRAHEFLTKAGITPTMVNHADGFDETQIPRSMFFPRGPLIELNANPGSLVFVLPYLVEFSMVPKNPHGMAPLAYDRAILGSEEKFLEFNGGEMKVVDRQVRWIEYV